ncbi:hypothetical protein [uncultured Jannaschia sp.]|uniref:hypothetical protein n=1 Tax=uncultured Jannaschia sp. TaxID=293347 RepID=UPI002612C587|nr:hypothetical protein [uncultured Jannaschia sp.]
MIRALPLVLLVSACIGGGGGFARNGPGAADFVDADRAVTPGLASCLNAIGRPDMINDPGASMSNAEIEGLLACTSERASQ